MEKTLTDIVNGKRVWTKHGLEVLDGDTHAKRLGLSLALTECGLSVCTYSNPPMLFMLSPHIFIRITRGGRAIIGKYDPGAVAQDDEMEDNILEYVEDPITLFETIRAVWERYTGK